MELSATTTVARPVREVYDFWKRFENLPTFMTHLEEVHTTGERSTHWKATAPFGRTVEWDAETVLDEPPTKISWQSLPGADVPNQGSVWFVEAPAGRGTEIHVVMAYDIPGGPIGAAIARFFGEEPHQQLDDDLRRLKQVLETGEVVRSDGAPGGKRARREFPQRAAQPLPPAERDTYVVNLRSATEEATR